MTTPAGNLRADEWGRAYFERRVAESKTKREALPALKRQTSVSPLWVRPTLVDP